MLVMQDDAGGLRSQQTSRECSRDLSQNSVSPTGAILEQGVDDEAAGVDHLVGGDEGVL